METNYPAQNPCLTIIQNNISKWRDFLDRFEDVLKVNIFLLDAQDQVLVAPHLSGSKIQYGADFLQKAHGFQPERLFQTDFLTRFDQKDSWLYCTSPFDFYLFAVPVRLLAGKVTLYLLVGPVIIDGRWPQDKYLRLSEKLNLQHENFLAQVNQVPCMTRDVLDAALDMLGEVFKDVLELEMERQTLEDLRASSNAVPPQIADAARDLYAQIQQDELLVTVLDSAIRVARADSGSIMLFDRLKGDLVLKVSRGLENKKNILQSRVKIGEGLAGFAAQTRECLYLSDETDNKYIRPLLNRPDIKESFVIPLLANESVVGVLNLSTKNKNICVMIKNPNDIRQLSSFIATALGSIPTETPA